MAFTPTRSGVVQQWPRRDGEEGGIAILGLGLAVCIAMLTSAGISVATVSTARVDVLAAADHAAADAADRLSLAETYADGVADPHLDPAEVDRETRAVLAASPLPPHVSSWQVTQCRVTGNRIQLRVRAVVKPAVLGSVMSALGTPLTVNVATAADAHVVR